MFNEGQKELSEAGGSSDRLMEQSNHIDLWWESLLLLQRPCLSKDVKPISWTFRNKAARDWKWKCFEIFGASDFLYILWVVVVGLCPACHGSESQRACSSWRNVFVWSWCSRSVPSFWWLLIHDRWVNKDLSGFQSILELTVLALERKIGE